jgi:hypothetical protein
MTNLEWDLGEWFWGGTGIEILVPFYQYTSRIRYRSITRHEGTKSVITTILNEEGMKTKHVIGTLNQLWHQTKHVIGTLNQLWHQTRPRKVTMLIWLALSHGVLARA